MAYSRLNFTKNWGNEADFPRYEENETQVRADLQELHDQTREYVNNTLIPELEAEVFGGKTWLDRTVAVGDWIADETIPLFPFRASLPAPGVTAYDVPLVTFAEADADSGILCPLAETRADEVCVFASEIPAQAVSVRSIFCVKGGGV